MAYSSVCISIRLLVVSKYWLLTVYIYIFQSRRYDGSEARAQELFDLLAVSKCSIQLISLGIMVIKFTVL